eukprot:331054-Prorocentrum_minimum.AAC.1
MDQSDTASARRVGRPSEGPAAAAFPRPQVSVEAGIVIATFVLLLLPFTSSYVPRNSANHRPASCRLCLLESRIRVALELRFPPPCLLPPMPLIHVALRHTPATL